MAVQLESAARLAALRDKADAVTGESSATLDGAVDALIAGFGSGGGTGENWLDYVASLSGLFSEVTFEEGTNIDISVGKKSGKTIGSMQTAFSGTKGVRKIKLSCNEQTNAVSWLNAFRMSSVEVIDLTEFKVPIGDAKQVFALTDNLKEVLGELNCASVSTFNSTFHIASALETIRFVPGTIKASVVFSYSSALTDESIQSIVDGLADLTGGTAQTLTLHATVGAKLTDAQKTAISAKNWTVTY